MRQLLLVLFLYFGIAIPASAYQLGDWNVHGTFSQGWIHSEDNNFIEDSTDGTFDFREFGINASTLVAQKVNIGGQLFGRTYGVVGDDEIYIDWLSASYSLNDQIGFRAGKLRMSYGLHGASRDIDSLRTQILLPQGVYIESFRGSLNALWGGSLFGRLEAKRWGALDYSLQIGKSDIDEDSGEFNRLASLVRLEADSVNDGDAGAVELVWTTPVKGLRLGATYSVADFVAEGPTENTLGVEGRFRGDVKEQYFFIASAEYALRRATFTFEHLDAKNELSFLVDALPIGPLSLDSSLSGYYLSADYRATNALSFAVGYSAMSLKQVVSGLNLGTTINDRQNGVYASLRYDITPNLIAKVEQHFSDGQAALFLSENPDGLEDEWSMTLLKLSFVF